MADYPNFYENHEEALRRLNNTVITYDGEPYYVVAITDNPDGIFRMYLYPLGIVSRQFPLLPPISGIPANHAGMAKVIDDWMATKEGENSGMIRKMMNSPKFNKFRPFPLGMYNDSNRCCYIERQPNRKVEQGLIKSMLDVNLVTAGRADDTFYGRDSIDFFSPSFRACAMNQHPSAKTCLDNLLNPTIKNEAAGFCRTFAFVRGPIGMMFLAYKADIVGVLPNNDFSKVKIGRDFSYVKEAVEELKLFNDIVVEK